MQKWRQVVRRIEHETKKFEPLTLTAEESSLCLEVASSDGTEEDIMMARVLAREYVPPTKQLTHVKNKWLEKVKTRSDRGKWFDTLISLYPTHFFRDSKVTKELRKVFCNEPPTVHLLSSHVYSPEQVQSHLIFRHLKMDSQGFPLTKGTKQLGFSKIPKHGIHPRIRLALVGDTQTLFPTCVWPFRVVHLRGIDINHPQDYQEYVQKGGVLNKDRVIPALYEIARMILYGACLRHNYDYNVIRIVPTDLFRMINDMQFVSLWKWFLPILKDMLVAKKFRPNTVIRIYGLSRKLQAPGLDTHIQFFSKQSKYFDPDHEQNRTKALTTMVCHWHHQSFLGGDQGIQKALMDGSQWAVANTSFLHQPFFQAKNLFNK